MIAKYPAHALCESKPKQFIMLCQENYTENTTKYINHAVRQGRKQRQVVNRQETKDNRAQTKIELEPGMSKRTDV